MGCNIYYFSGAYSQPLKRAENTDQLFSVYLEKKLIINTIQYKKDHPEYTGRIMVDSGAFSFYQQAKKKNKVITDDEMNTYVDDYIKFLNEYGKDIECFVAVDSVPDPNNVDQTYAQKTWDNYLYMYSKLNEDIRDKLIPVFHYGEDFKWLRNFLEYKHEDGSHIAYIGLAISLEGTKKVRITWGQECMNIIAHSSNPDVKTHAFGCTILRLLEEFPLTSADSATWAISAAFGSVRIGDKSIVVSDRTVNKSTNIVNKSAAHRQAVEDRIKENGLTLKELQEDPYLRQVMTVRELKRWEENYKCTYQGVVKNDLW